MNRWIVVDNGNVIMIAFIIYLLFFSLIFFVPVTQFIYYFYFHYKLALIYFMKENYSTFDFNFFNLQHSYLTFVI